MRRADDSERPPRGGIVADFAVLEGVDEFGGVLAGTDPVVGVVTSLQTALRPVGSRYAAIVGEIDVSPRAADVATAVI